MNTQTNKIRSNVVITHDLAKRIQDRLFTVASALPAAKLERDELRAVLDNHDDSDQADHDRLIRELDVLLNGVEGAARQASLCDIVAQVRKQKAGL